MPCSRACSSVSPNERDVRACRTSRAGCRCTRSGGSPGRRRPRRRSRPRRTPCGRARGRARGRRSRRRPWRDVRSAPSTSISPLSSSLTPASSRPSALDVGPAAGGDHEAVGLAGLVAVGEGDLVVAASATFSTSVPVWTSMPCLLEPALGDLGDVGVLGRQHAVERLEQQHLGAEPRRTPRRSRRPTRRRRRRRSSPAAPRAPTPPRCRSRGRRTACPGSAWAPSRSRARPPWPRSRCRRSCRRP